MAIPKGVLQVDKQLRDLVVKFELLSNVNPTNTETEKKKFFRSKYTVDPAFKYKDLHIHLFEFKRNLASLKVENIEEPQIRELYEDTIESFMEKIDMLSHLGQEKFLYSSLKYFGQPNERDIKQAQFLLMCPDFIEEDDAQIYNAEQAVEMFKAAQSTVGFPYNVKIKKGMVARVSVSNAKKYVYVNPKIMFSKRDIDGLINHEVGVHLATTINAREQPLRIFSIGFPNNTKTQEGLSVATEYLSDNINLKRLRELALRVLAVNYMVKGNDFKTTFVYLIDEFKYNPDDAYRLTTRVFRGGGFTKDYVYLRGLRSIIRLMEQKVSLVNLFAGKTSFEYLDTINHMVEMGYAKKPEHVAPYFTNDSIVDTHPILRYVLEGITVD